MGPHVIDASVLGDYCHWTAGPRLTATGIRQLYSGMFATALDEAEAGMAGKMDESLKSTQSSSVAGTAAAFLPMLLGGIRSSQKATVSPNSDTKANAGDIRTREVLTNQPSTTPEQSMPMTPSNTKHATAVRSVRVLEIVMRPDVALKEIMTICYKVSRATMLRYGVILTIKKYICTSFLHYDVRRCTMSQNCHMVLETAVDSDKKETVTAYTGKGGWNTIDIQVYGFDMQLSIYMTMTSLHLLRSLFINFIHFY